MGKRFVDASGNSNLVYFAGGETEVGREKKATENSPHLKITTISLSLLSTNTLTANITKTNL